jgi:hypothetical protein
MIKIIRFILNHIINNSFDTVMSQAIGIDDIVSNLPFKLPTPEQIHLAAHNAAKFLPSGKRDCLAFHRIGILAQQTGDEPMIRLQQEIEGAIIIKVFLADSTQPFKVVVFGDDNGSWQYFGPLPMKKGR